MDRSISTACSMIDPGTSADQGLPLDPRGLHHQPREQADALAQLLRVGRNMDEMRARCTKALQLSYKKSVATPANWPYNHADIPLADGTRSTDYQGLGLPAADRLARRSRGSTRATTRATCPRRSVPPPRQGRRTLRRASAAGALRDVLASGPSPTAPTGRDPRSENPRDRERARPARVSAGR